MVPVLIAALAYFVLGALWFGGLFARPYAQALDKSEAELQGLPVAPSMITSAAASVITAWALSILATLFESSTATEGVQIGLLAWIGFAFTSIAPIYYHEHRSKTLLVIYGSYTLVSYLLMGTIVAVWR